MSESEHNVELEAFRSWLRQVAQDATIPLPTAAEWAEAATSAGQQNFSPFLSHQNIILVAEPAAVSPPPPAPFPHFWELFPFVLPRGVRERVYGPAHQELLEDYLQAAALRPGRWGRRWLTFVFTLRTAGVISGSMWAALGAAGRRAVVATLTFAAGASGYTALRELVAAWRGRLS